MRARSETTFEVELRGDFHFPKLCQLAYRPLSLLLNIAHLPSFLAMLAFAVGKICLSSSNDGLSMLGKRRDDQSITGCVRLFFLGATSIKIE